jgi:hypothetical protein
MIPARSALVTWSHKMTKTLMEKLGCKAGMAGWMRQCPAELAPLLTMSTTAPETPPDMILAFVENIADVLPALASVHPHYVRGAALWFAYPKKTGRIKTDITRDLGWEPLAAADLLPVAQIALDDTWSALRFRYRDEIAKLTRQTDIPGKRDNKR